MRDRSPRYGQILVVDPDPDALASIAGALRDQGYRVLATSDPAQAVDAVRSESISLMLLGTQLAGLGTCNLLGELAARRLHVPTVLIGTRGVYRRPPNVVGYLGTPFGPLRLGRVVERFAAAATA
jgi:DNA-binding NtrC family response regulator